VFNWDISSVPDGRYALVVTARDAAGNAAADTARVQVRRPDVDPPVVAILSPPGGSILAGIVPIFADVQDTSPIDSVTISIRVPTGSAVRESLFVSPPYSMNWDTRILPQAVYDVCAAARDSAGNRSARVCNSVTVYPPVQLRYDDGEVDAGRGYIGVSYQVASVFQNPYDVPVRVDTLEFFIHQESAITAPFRFVLWNVQAGRPTTEAEGTPILAIRNPRGVFGFYVGWNTILPPHGYIAAGMQQLGSDLVAIGVDMDNPFTEQTHYLTSPAGTPTWADLAELQERVVPMIHLYVGVVSDVALAEAASNLDQPAARHYGTRPARRINTQFEGWVQRGEAVSPSGQ
jgi:hypothetical protein